jgi:GDPmannose 4,6-dehydratase
LAKTALITGVAGQDDSYLADFLTEMGYDVHGIRRRAFLFNTKRVDHIYQDSHGGGRPKILNGLYHCSSRYYKLYSSPQGR